MQAGRGPVYGAQGSPSLDRRPVRCHHPRELGRRQRALYEMGSLSSQHPCEEAIVEGKVVDEGQPVGQLSPQAQGGERGDGGARQ